MLYKIVFKYVWLSFVQFYMHFTIIIIFFKVVLVLIGGDHMKKYQIRYIVVNTSSNL